MPTSVGPHPRAPDEVGDVPERSLQPGLQRDRSAAAQVSQLAFHEGSGARATLTAVQPPGRFGSIQLMPGTHQITRFMEKPRGDGGWVRPPLEKLGW